MKNIILFCSVIIFSACSDLRFGDALDGRSFRVDAISIAVDDSVSDNHQIIVSDIVSIPTDHFELSFDAGDAVLKNRFGFEEFLFTYHLSGRHVYEMVSVDSLSTECCGNIGDVCSGLFALDNKGNRTYFLIGNKGTVFVLTEQ